jgi:succinate dehydrogenase/fumarate reductase flavoprotein subunit
VADAFDAEYDLIVLGAGAAGMTAALVAAIEGARPLLVESTAYVGGTSARSSGTLWIPECASMVQNRLSAWAGMVIPSCGKSRSRKERAV